MSEQEDFNVTFDALKAQKDSIPTAAGWGLTGAFVGSITAALALVLGLAIAYRWNPWLIAGLVVLTGYGIGRCRRAPLGAYASGVAHTAVEATERMLTIFGLLEEATREEEA